MNSRRKFRMEQKRNGHLNHRKHQELEKAVLVPVIQETYRQIVAILRVPDPEGPKPEPELPRPIKIQMNQNVANVLGPDGFEETVRELAAATGEPEVNVEVVPNGQLSEQYGFRPRCQTCNQVIGLVPECTTDYPGASICMECGHVSAPSEPKREWATNSQGGYLTRVSLFEEVQFAQGTGPMPDRKWEDLNEFTVLQIRKAMLLFPDSALLGIRSRSTRSELESIFNKMNQETRYKVSRYCAQFARS